MECVILMNRPGAEKKGGTGYWVCQTGKKGGLFIKRWIFIRLSRKSENGYKVAAQDHELYWNASR
jgi:hypothetical protein